MEVVGIVDTIFGFVGSVTAVVRDLVTSVAGGWTSIALLGLSVVAGYYVSRRYPHLSGTTAIALYSLVIFLLLKFV